MHSSPALLTLTVAATTLLTVTTSVIAEPEAAPADHAPLTLRNGNKDILTYQTSFIPSPDPAAPWFGRSGFIHPVRTPAGRVVTDDFPGDHLHQHGIMMAWTKTVIDGRPVDFWNSKKQQGRIEHVETVQADDDKITVKLRHLNTTAKPPVPVLEETWTLTRVPHPTMHVFDLVSIQVCLMDQPLQLKKYHYGGLCVRGAADWGPDATFLTDLGKSRANGNHSRAKWVAIAGTTDGAACGLACLGHPDNFRAPQPVRLHPEMPYFSFAPAVLGDFQIKPGEPYITRFRFAAFDGKPDPEALNKLWSSLAKP